jgi:phospholipase D1/2
VTLTNLGGLSWIRVVALVLMCALAVVVWTSSSGIAVTINELAAWIEPHRRAWYALPVVMVAFVMLGLAMVPVILLVAATGVAFGPLLGPVYAMAGCLASASTGFAIGRWMGLQRVNTMGGDRIVRVTRALKRNGTFAVFLARKVPAPFTLANIVIGASTVRFWDFIIGTVLGMGALVVGLAGFGYQLTKAWRDPSPASLLGAALFVIVPLTLALVINYAFRRLRPVE